MLQAQACYDTDKPQCTEAALPALWSSRARQILEHVNLCPVGAKSRSPREPGSEKNMTAGSSGQGSPFPVNSTQNRKASAKR